MFNRGRRVNRRPRNDGNRGRGIGRGNPREEPQEVDPVEYINQVNLDDEALDDLRATASRHQYRRLQRETRQLQIETGEAEVVRANVDRMREETRLRTTRATTRRAQTALESERRSLDLEEQISALERQFNRP